MPPSLRAACLKPELQRIEDVFDRRHYAATWRQKLIRSVQLAPRYYLWDVPKYLSHRRAFGLPTWDWGVLWNPLREFHLWARASAELPERYDEALALLRDAGIRLNLPPARVASLAAAWWITRMVEGDVMECGAYRGASSLLLALLGRLHKISQKVLILDTFAGVAENPKFDIRGRGRDYVPPANQIATIDRQAELLGIADRISIHEGLFFDMFAKLRDDRRRFALVHIDANLFEGTREACEFALPRMSQGGTIVFDDYNGVCDLGARLAIECVLAPRGLHPSPLVGSSAFLRIDGPHFNKRL